MPRLIIVLDCPGADPTLVDPQWLGESLIDDDECADGTRLISAHWSNPDTPEPESELLTAAREVVKVLGHRPEGCMWYLRNALNTLDPDTPEERER